VRRIVVVLVVALAFVACGWDWTVVPNADVDAGTTPDGGVAESGVEAGREGGTGKGCRSNDECGSGELCVFPDFRCGAGLAGECYPPYPPAKCPFAESAACGCDGQTATDRCATDAKRIDVSTEAKCAAPPNTFRCGFLFCNSETEFCFEVRTAELSDFVCFPWECGEKSCQCDETKQKCKISSCATDADLHTLVVCTQLEEGK
jgi:hypothetical protein